MTTPSLMMNPQQSASDAWSLAPGEVRSLTTGPGERWLRVSEGRVWLTLPGSVDEPADDVWLETGETVALPEGSRLVLEGWPSARFQLLVPPQACQGSSLLRRVSERFAVRHSQPALSAHAA
jgi:hypothetical protein